jgi:hypothetical protein
MIILMMAPMSIVRTPFPFSTGALAGITQRTIREKGSCVVAAGGDLWYQISVGPHPEITPGIGPCGDDIGGRADERRWV